MTSPFPKSSSLPGEGQLVARPLPNGITGLSTITYQYPLKLISPSPTFHQKSVLVFLLSYGGGLVGGDQISLRITVESRARLSVVTQGHTKIFKSATQDVITRQKLQVTIESGGAMCLLPDPVQPFAGSIYEQLQSFKLIGDASICLLDWVSQGRSARGEDWDFSSWKGRNEIWFAEDGIKAPRLVLRDNVILDNETSDSGDGGLSSKMHGLALFGTLILKGPLVEPLARFFMTEFAALPRIGARDFRTQQDLIDFEMSDISEYERWRLDRLKQEKDNGILWSAAKVRGCTVVKFGARSVEGGRDWIGSMLRQEGCITQTFGYDALMCVQ